MVDFLRNMSDNSVNQSNQTNGLTTMLLPALKANPAVCKVLRSLPVSTLVSLQEGPHSPEMMIGSSLVVID